MSRRTALLLLGVAACGDSVVAPVPDASDAGVDAVVEAAPPAEAAPPVEAAPPADGTDDCAVVPGTVPAAEDECDPCKGRVFSEGASCGDLTAGFQCEVGSHPAWYCNDVWECNANLTWKRIAAAHASAVCQTSVVVGWACNQHYGGCPHPTGVPCLETTKSEVCIFDDPWSTLRSDCVSIDHTHTRFGCPCQHADLSTCGYKETCASGRWHLELYPPCVGP